MPKARSPGYPAIGLKEAVEKVRAVYAKDYQNKLPKLVMAQHMGYKSLSGASLPVLAALGKFGLIEGRGDQTWVSDLALAIIAHEPGTPERITAMKEAAETPALFSELDEKFPGGKGSDAAIRAYLLTQKFIPEAADAAIRAYRETKQLVEDESRGYARLPHETGTEMSALRQPSKAREAVTQASFDPPYPSPEVQPPQGSPYKIGLLPDAVTVTAALRDRKALKELVQRLAALETFLPEPLSSEDLDKIGQLAAEARRSPRPGD